MILHEPKLYLVTKPEYDYNVLADFLHDHDHDHSDVFCDHHELDADQAVATGGRLCYNSFSHGRPPEEYLPRLLGQRHYSVLEHAFFGILFTGVSRSWSHEIIRHRHFGFSEQSQRYIDVPARFVKPPLMPEGRVEAWHESQMDAWAKYQEKIEACVAAGLTRKEAHGMARARLPESTETRILVTGNLRTWREFLEQRLDPAADAEIRRTARETLKLLSRHTTCLDEFLS